MVHAKFTDLPPELLSQILEIPNCIIHNPLSSSQQRILRTTGLVNRLLASVARPALFYHIDLPERSPRRFMALLEAIISSPSMQRWIHSIGTRLGVPWQLQKRECPIFADVVPLLSSIIRFNFGLGVDCHPEDGTLIVGGWDEFPTWFRQPVEESLFPKLIYVGVNHIHSFPYGTLFRHCLSLEHLELSLDAPPPPVSSPVTTSFPLAEQAQRPRLRLSIKGESASFILDDNFTFSPLSSLREEGVELGHLSLVDPPREVSAISSLFQLGHNLRIFETQYHPTPKISYAGLDLSSLPFLETFTVTFHFNGSDHGYMNQCMDTLARVASTAVALQKLRLHVKHSFSYLTEKTTDLRWVSLDETIVKRPLGMVIISFNWLRGAREGPIYASAEETSAIFRDAIPLAAGSGKLRIYELQEFDILNEYCSVCQSH
ncbi:hypothetical protein DL96DRAFT_1721604 [Flagelloscypha sp. PMI_526]|nr:hypothetical protein DL96DRAFT_1721604 [Flagelloscypha sp. PMI_526]